MKFRWTMLIFVAAMLCVGCTGPLVGVTVVDERTALENQVLGSYEELNEEVMLVASVRYIDADGKLVKRDAVPPGKLKAIRAMQRSAFNKDDLDGLKEQGLVGENKDGGVTLLAPGEVEPDKLAFVENLIEEENADREVIMLRIIETNETLSERDVPSVQRTFAALNRDKARPGEMVQLNNGEWVKKAPR